MRDYMPRKPETVTGWMERFAAYLGENYERLGLTEDDLAMVEDLNSRWLHAFNEQVAARIAYHGKTHMRDNVQAEVGEIMRPLIRRIQSAPATTDTDRTQLGITVYGGSEAAGTPLSQEKPVVRINISGRQKHEMKIHTMTPTGPKRAKPEGVIGCEIRRKIGSAPEGIEDMDYVMIATKPTVEIEYPMADVGQTVYYMMRWIHKSGETSDWSQTASATVTA